jgi:hypothetical protein
MWKLHRSSNSAIATMQHVIYYDLDWHFGGNLAQVRLIKIRQNVGFHRMEVCSVRVLKAAENRESEKSPCLHEKRGLDHFICAKAL